MTQDVTITLKDGNNNNILLRAREYDDDTLAFYHARDDRLTGGTNKSGTITSASVSQLVAAENSNRIKFSFQNTSDTPMYLSEDGEPASILSYQILPNGTAEINTYYAINVFCSAAGKTFAATEVQKIYDDISESYIIDSIQEVENLVDEAEAIVSNAEDIFDDISTIEAAQYRYVTYAAALAALASIPADEFVYVFADENYNGRVTIYRKTGGVLVFQNTLTGEPVQWYVDSLTGNDTNPGTREAPFETPLPACNLATFGDTVWFQPNSPIKPDFEWDDLQGTVPAGVNFRVIGGGRAPWLCVDELVGTWTVNGASWTSPNVTHLFGGAGSKKGVNRLYPNILYRIDGETKWRQVAATYRNDHASDAAGIAWAQAGEGRLYIQDSSGSGSSYTAGWQAGGPFIYHVRLAYDTDPNDCLILVKQREALYFNEYHIFEGIDIIGSIGHQGLYIKSSLIRNVEVTYTGSHGVIIPGCDSENFTVRSNGGGYMLHCFGEEDNWLTQTRGYHKSMRLIDCPGEMFGCHGVGQTTPAPGGALGDTVMGAIIFDDLYCENVQTFGGMAQVACGIVFNRPVINGLSNLGGFAVNTVLNEPRITFDIFRSTKFETTTNPLGLETGNNSNDFVTPHTGFQVTIKGGQSVSYRTGNAFRGGGGGLGTLRFEGHKYVKSNAGSGFADFNALALGTIQIVQGSRFQFTGSSAGTVAAFISGTQPATVEIERSHIGGAFFIFPGVTATIDIDSHSVIGGDTGLTASGNYISPVDDNSRSSGNGVGERLVMAYPAPSNRSGRATLILTSEGFYFASNPASTHASLPSGFVPRGVGGYADSDRLIMYGDNGLAYFVEGAAGPGGTPALVTTGVTTDFTGSFRNQGKVFLLGDNGEILEVVMATGACTVRTSPVTFRLLGGIALDANNFIAYGCDEDETAGGVIYSTDGGVTWTENASVTSNGIRTAALVNGLLCVGGKGFSYGLPVFWTCATVGGTFVARNFAGQLSWMHFGSDVPNKRIVFTARGLTGVHLGGGNYDTGRNGPFNQVGYIDASDANPDNWKVKILPKPIPDVTQITFNAQSGYVEYFSPTRGFARGAASDSLDYSYDLPNRPRWNALASYDTSLALNSLFA